MTKITYANKNKAGAFPADTFRDSDANEIKTVVNKLRDDYDIKTEEIYKTRREIPFYDAGFGFSYTTGVKAAHSAIKSIVLIGDWDRAKKYSLSYMYRNHSTQNYRFTIFEVDDAGANVATVYDTGTSFIVTETGNATLVAGSEISGRSVLMVVDYAFIPNTTGYNFLNANNYVIKPSAISVRLDLLNEIPNLQKSTYHQPFYDAGWGFTYTTSMKLAHSAIKSIVLIGDWDRTKRYGVRAIYRNHSTQNYRLGIQELNDDGTVKVSVVYDSTTSFTLTEAGAGKPTVVSFPEWEGRTVIAIIDYNIIVSGYAFLGDSNYLIKPSAIFSPDTQNLPYVTKDVEDFEHIDFCGIRSVTNSNHRQTLPSIPFSTNSKKGFTCFRVDNGAIVNIKHAETLSAIFDKFNARFTLCENIADVVRKNRPERIDIFRSLLRRGHELGDHTPNHNLDMFDVPPGYEGLFDGLIGNGIDSISSGVAYTTRDFPGVYTDHQIGLANDYEIEIGTSKVHGDFSMLSTQGATNYYYYYLYIDNLTGDKIGWQPIKVVDYTASGYVEIQKPGGVPIIFAATETISMYAINFSLVKLTESATYALLLAGQCWFRYYGFPQPKTWVHPGGMWAIVTSENLEKVMPRLGMKFANTTFGGTNVLTYNHQRENPNSAHWWGGTNLHFDSDNDLSAAKITIAEDVAKKRIRTFGSHIQFNHFPGADADEKLQNFYKFIYDLLSWLNENKILVTTIEEMALILNHSKSDRYANIFPDLYTDIAEQSKPDGYVLGSGVVWLNDDGAPEDKEHSLKLNGNGNIFTITDLGGLEKGDNDFSCYLKGNIGSIVTITIGSIGDVVFTIDSASWKKYKLSDSTGITSISIPHITNYITITAVASNNTSTDVFISGIVLKGN